MLIMRDISMDMVQAINNCKVRTNVTIPRNAQGVRPGC